MARKRRAIAELVADDRRLGKGLRRAEGRFRRAGRRMAASLKRSFQGFSGLAGLGAGFGLAQIGRDVLNFEDQLQRVGSQARLSASEVDSFRARINDLSEDTGLAREQLIAGIDEIVNLQGGSAATATNLDTMSTALLGTGSAASEVAGLMFALSENMGVAEGNMKGALAVIDRIGAEKSIPFKQLAAELAALSGEAKEFGSEGVEGTARLVATMQALRTRFKGVAEVSTGIKGAMTAFLRKEKDLAKFGVRVRDSNGELRTFLDIVEDIRDSKLGKNSSKLMEVMGRAEGFRAVEETMNQFEEIQRLANLGLENKGFLDERARERLESDVGRLDRSFNKMKLSIAEAFTPERIERFANSMEKVAKLIEWAADNATDLLAMWVGLKGFAGARSLGLLGGAGAGAGAAGAGGSGAGAAAAGGTAARFASRAAGVAGLLFTGNKTGIEHAKGSTASLLAHSRFLATAQNLGNVEHAERLRKAIGGMTMTDVGGIAQGLDRDIGPQDIIRAAEQKLAGGGGGLNSEEVVSRLVEAIADRPVKVLLDGAEVQRKLEDQPGERVR